MHDCKKIKINKAFSLVEISIVIIIISVITVGIISGLNIASSARLKLATNLTHNSPILSMKNLDLWYETTLADESLTFVDGIDEDGAKISGWNDIFTKIYLITINPLLQKHYHKLIVMLMLIII